MPEFCFATDHLSFAYPQTHAVPSPEETADRSAIGDFGVRKNGAALHEISLSVPRGQFVLLCGVSGSGKSTLLRLLKPSAAPHGTRSGSILFCGEQLDTLPPADAAAKIAFVGQSPQAGIVTDRVWHELAFGAESLGWNNTVIRARVAETASFFGIADLFHRDTASLSGGQKQLVCLASAMVLRPEVLLLDEPTAQLDPIAAEQFFSVLKKINTELGTTILITEHRLESVFPLCDRVVVLDGGHIAADGTPQSVGNALFEQNSPMRHALPCAARVYHTVVSQLPHLKTAHPPVSVREGTGFLQSVHAQSPLTPPDRPEPTTDIPPVVLSAEGLCYRYPDGEEDVLRGMTLQVRSGDCYAILGSNGAGKSTALSILGGIRRPDAGHIDTALPTRLLPQEPGLLFTEKTLRISFAKTHTNPADTHFSEAETQLLSFCGLLPLMDRNPRDLSGGELQRAALALVLFSLVDHSGISTARNDILQSLTPAILLLDEPTKGTDAAFKRDFGQLLHALRRRGFTVVLISHDIPFCAENAHTCALFFDGAVTSEAPTAQFFTKNRFYTTAAHRISAPLLDSCYTDSDLISACGAVPEEKEHCFANSPWKKESRDQHVAHLFPPDASIRLPLRDPVSAAQHEKAHAPAFRGRRIASAILFVCALILFVCVSKFTDLHTMTEFAVGNAALPWRDFAWYAAFLAVLLAAVFTAPLPARPPSAASHPVKNADAKPRRRTWLSCVLLWLCVPPTLLLGMHFLGDRGYPIISILVLIEAMLPFFILFEGGKPSARRIALIACLCAVGVAGRAAFFMLPHFKPVLAFVILIGVSLGAQTGFLCGALTMLLSNMLFGQGPWTPWQMFAMGMAGFFAGLLFYRRADRGQLSRAVLCIFGALYAVILYGGIMNLSSALIYGQTFSLPTVLSFYITGFPMDCIHAGATVLFLQVLTEPITEQLLRIRRKFGV